jgi:hypothetical protein
VTRSSRLAIAVPAVAIAALLPWVIYCARSYHEHALYFDHSMYQYTGWCIRNGVSLYDQVAVPDGPFITWLHALVQMIAGESDAAFRVADLVIQSLGAFAVGFVIAPRRRRALWAGAIATLWLAQYFRYDWHWTAQREAYYALVGYLGMATLLLATRRTGRRAMILALVGGVLVGSQLFGKHTGVIFIALGLVPAILGVRPRLRRRVLLALGGVGLALVICFALLALTGSIKGWLFWFIKVPGPYRYIMGSADPLALLFGIDRHTTVLATVAMLGGFAAVYWRVLPRSYLGFVVAPVLFLVAMALQRKGHVYQAHPITAGTYLVFALIAIHLIKRQGRYLIAGTALMALVVVDATYQLTQSTWMDPDPPNELSQLGAAHVNHADLTLAGRRIAELSKPGDRVFAMGPAGRLLYTAKRRPAVPPFNNFFLNVKRASVIELSPDRRADLDELQGMIATRSCPLLKERPAVLALCDWAAWSGGPALADVLEVCPQLNYIYSEYAEAGVIGCWRLYTRK